jgi:hypothetical protein
LLEFLTKKRERMARMDVAGLEEMQPRAEELTARLGACQSRRQTLLDKAASEGREAVSLRQLARTLATDGRSDLEKRAKNSAGQLQLLRHQSLTNWIIAQRTLLHVAEMLQIVATGGRLQPTYGPGSAATDCGGLLNQEA